MIQKNRVELFGRVGYIECKFLENDKASVKTDVLLGIKKENATGDSENDWENFFVTFWNTKKTATAENIAEKIKKGDYIRIVGKLVENRYIPKGLEQIKENEKTEINIVGYGFKKMIFDDFENTWVEA